MNTQQYQLGHLNFHSADTDTMVDTINHWLEADADSASTPQTAKAIAYVNPHVYNVSFENPSIVKFLNQCSLMCVDGIGTALALSLQSRRKVDRVVALHLFDNLIKRLSVPCKAVLIGVTQEEVEQSARNINALDSQFEIIDALSGFAEPEQYDVFLKKHASIQWVLIGAGSPKSEFIAQQALHICERAIIFHMGAGTIKVYAGSKRRAHAWVSKAGLEWIHRVIHEPHTRQRYGKGIVQFLLRAYVKQTPKQPNTAKLTRNNTEGQT